MPRTAETPANSPKNTPPAPSPASGSKTGPDTRPTDRIAEKTPDGASHRDERTREIIQLHSEIEDPRSKVEKAIRAGELLSEMKTELKNGSWTAYKKALPFSDKTCWNYIRLFEYQAKHPARFVKFTNLTDAYKIVDELRAAEKAPRKSATDADDSGQESATNNEENSPTEKSKKPPVDREKPKVQLYFDDEMHRKLFESKLRRLAEDGRYGATDAEVAAYAVDELDRQNAARGENN